MENKKNKGSVSVELTDEALDHVSGGANETEANLERDCMKDETMLIIPIL